MKHRGKVIALSTAAVGVAVLVVTAVAARGYVVGQYYIRELRSPDEAVRLRAAEALGEMRSTRAVPHLIRLLEQEKRERVQWSGSRVATVYGPEGSTHASLQPAPGIQMTPLAFALYRIGKGALPGLQEAERLEKQRILDEDFMIRWSSNSFLGILSEIISAINSPGQVVWGLYYGDSVDGIPAR